MSFLFYVFMAMALDGYTVEFWEVEKVRTTCEVLYILAYKKGKGTERSPSY